MVPHQALPPNLLCGYCEQTNRIPVNMNKKIVFNFIDAINEHNVDTICSLMTNDHRFIDSHGNEAVGKDTMKAGWIGYFQLFPDYTIEIEDVFLQDDSAALFGYAGGTLKGSTRNRDNSWRLPAAWKTIVKGEKIFLWQVYADSKIPYDIINKAKKQ
jgi:ketosteroid isomerase-like protein